MYIEANGTEMLKAILDSIDEGIHVINQDGITTYYNKVAAMHDGVEVDEVLGKHVLEVFPSLSRATSTLLQVIETGQAIYQQQQSYTNIRGKHIDTVNTTLPIIVHRKIVGAVEIAKDYTTIKQLSEKLLDLQEKVTKHPPSKTEPDYNHTVFQLNDLISNSPKIDEMKKRARQAAKTSSPILVYGETGTGKELLVQGIHHASSRKKKPFIAQNCAAIPSSLLEGILFGTVKGSFTGAIDRPGLFELADGGTLFLDEMNSMPLDIQAKLLRVLQDGVVRRVGSIKGAKFDVRIITAMNDHPLACIEKKLLREDLYYRISVVSLRIPPLRERKEDIKRLSEHFMKKYNFQFQKLVTAIAPDVLQLFEHYRWPGNVRELEHTIEAAMNMADGNSITREHLPFHFIDHYQAEDSSIEMKPLRQAVEKVEKELISEALDRTNGNIVQAAKLLAIPRQTLQYKLSKYR